MKDKMKKLLESVVLKEAEFKSDDGISTVPEPVFSGEKPATDLPQAGEGKSKDAKNATLKGGKKDEPKKLKEEEENAQETAEVVAEAEETSTGEVIEEDAKSDLVSQLNNITAKISYYDKTYNAGEKKGVQPSAELTQLYAKKKEIKDKIARLTDAGPKKLKEAYTVDVSAVDVSEDIAAIFSSDDELTEEFKAKVTTIFEAAVIARANEVIQKIVTEANENIEKQYNELDEAFEDVHFALVTNAEEVYEAKTVEMTEKMEALTEKAIVEWKEENKVAIHSAAKVDIAESFMTNLKDLFETHNIEIPESKIDVTEALLAEVDSLKGRLDKEIEANLSLKEEIDNKRKKDLIGELSESLTDVEKGKFEALTENIDYASDEDYVSKLKQIKESYFAKKIDKVVAPIIEQDTGLDLVEEAPAMDPLMAAVLAAGKKLNGKK